MTSDEPSEPTEDRDGAPPAEDRDRAAPVDHRDGADPARGGGATGTDEGRGAPDPTDDQGPHRLTVAPDARSIPWKRLLSVSGVVVLAVVVAPFLVYAVPQVVGAEYSYVVLSGSMEPAISPGDVIVVDAADPGAIEEGDVITFARDGEQRTTTHRVIEVVERGDGVLFRTKGDNNEDPDQQLVQPDQVNGRVMSVGGALLVLPYVGYVIRYASSGTGFVLLFVLPTTLLVASELWTFVRSASSGPGGDGADDPGPAPRAESEPGSRSGDVDEGQAIAEGDGSAAGGTSVTDDRAAAVASAADGRGRPPDGVDVGRDGASARSAGGGVTISATELGLGVTVLGAFLVYSVWVAYAVTEVWSVGVAASVFVAFLMTGGLYYFGGGGDTGGRGAGEGDAAGGPTGTGGSWDATGPAASSPDAPDGRPDDDLGEGDRSAVPSERPTDLQDATPAVLDVSTNGGWPGRFEAADGPDGARGDPPSAANGRGGASHDRSGVSDGASPDHDEADGSTGGDDDD